MPTSNKIPVSSVLCFALLVFAVPCWASGLDLIKKGQAAEQAGKQNEALLAYSQAIQAGDLTKGQLAFAYHSRGGIKGFLGDNVDGIADYSKAIELVPAYGPARSLRGYLLGTVGQYDLAEKDHLAAIELAKGETWDEYLPWVLQHYADLWRRRKDFDQALSCCAQALQAKEYAIVYFRRAWIYLDMGRLAEAKADFQKFELDMKRQNISYDIFWPDERGAIARLRELR
jgi:tetratricopeptide (TPR) repeat protein